MGLIDAAVLLGILFVGVPVAVAIGVLLDKVFHAAWLRALPVVCVLGTAVAGVPLAFHFAGVRTDGRVVAREEQVHISWRTAGWSSDQWVEVRYRPLDIRRADPTTPRLGDAGDSLTGRMRISEAAFDRTPVGATVPVTYLAFRPNVAELTGRTLGDLGRETLAVGGAPLEILGLGVLLLTALVATRRPAGVLGQRVRRGTLAALAAAVFVVGAQVAFTSPAHGPDEPMPAPAAARVARVVVFRRGNMSRRRDRLPQPYQVAELVFTPRGARAPVRTADAVDSGSVPALTEGAVVPIHYAPDHPRAARVDGAARTFERANGRWPLLAWLACWAAGLAATLAVRRAGRRTATARA